jgi:ABC-type transport system substrate-binding protein
VNEGVQLELRKAGLWAHFLNPMEACQNGTPVCSPLVRRALTLAIDAETIASTIWKGMAVPVSVPALPGGPGYDATLPIPFDKAEAERLLDEAGYPRGADGVRMNLVYRFWNSGPFADSAFAMQDMWRDVGIEVDTAQIEKGLFVDHYARRKGLSPWDITGIHLSELLGNNAAYLDRMTTTIAGSANVFENEAFYALRDRVNAATGAAEQDKLLREAFRMISAHDGGDPPYVYMFASPAMTFLQSYVEGFEPLGGGLNFSFENIRLLYH